MECGYLGSDRGSTPGLLVHPTHGSSPFVAWRRRQHGGEVIALPSSDVGEFDVWPWESLIRVLSWFLLLSTYCERKKGIMFPFFLF